MNVVDSSGWLEYFADAANAEAFAPAVEDADQLAVPALVIFEVGRRIRQQRGEELASEAMAVLERLRVVPLDAELAIAAVRLGDEHRLAMADSIIYATAQSLGATLWTQDADFAGLPGVSYFAKT